MRKFWSLVFLAWGTCIYFSLQQCNRSADGLLMFNSSLTLTEKKVAGIKAFFVASCSCLHCKQCQNQNPEKEEKRLNEIKQFFQRNLKRHFTIIMVDSSNVTMGCIKLKILLRFSSLKLDLKRIKQTQNNPAKLKTNPIITQKYFCPF